MSRPVLLPSMHEPEAATPENDAGWEASPGRGYKRSLYVVDWPLQLRLTRQFAGFALLALVLGCADAYIVAALAESYTAVFPSDTAPRLAIWLYAALAILANFGVFFLVGLLYSHRLAGPQAKLVRFLEQMQEGDLGHHLQFRSTDYLHEVASALNSVVREWDRRFQTVREALQVLRQQAAMLERPDLIDSIGRAERVLDRFGGKGDKPRPGLD